MQPIIAIDRDIKEWAAFDGFDMIRKYQSYSSEEEALLEARAWFITKTGIQPEVVYPKLTKLTMTSKK